MGGRYILVAFLSLAWTAVSQSQQVGIDLYHDEIVESVSVSCAGGSYILRSGEVRIGNLSAGDIIFISMKGDSVRVFGTEAEYGTFGTIEMNALSVDGRFRIRPVEPSLESRGYDDDLSISSQKDFLRIINRVDMDKYISGVLESEIGPNAGYELYKAHALLTRTFLLKNFERHRDEGFSLCDGVHCQAYHGRASLNQDIITAVFETSGEVVTDFHYRLITAVYHSNSGGETQRASDVWLEDTDYLQAVIDPYSLHQSHAKWYDTIYFNDWKLYLQDKGMKSVKKIPDELLYVQQRHRKKYFVLDQDSILMTRIREDWGLKSTFFNMFPESGGRMVIWGKGYGHGVGMSQEGAMRMAELGFSYKDIIQFYFFNVRIMNYEDMPRSSLPQFEF